MAFGLYKVISRELIKILSQVPDPEIPVLTILDLGIVRKVEGNKNEIKVVITPTYSGCPAMEMIENQIKEKLQEHGYKKVMIETVLTPAWTTDWITDEAKNKLEAYGIAPPVKGTPNKGVLMGKDPEVKCPRCKSLNTEMVSQFGSTACKALYRCLDCLEPFDYFKCI